MVRTPAPAGVFSVQCACSPPEASPCATYGRQVRFCTSTDGVRIFSKLEIGNRVRLIVLARESDFGIRGA